MKQLFAGIALAAGLVFAGAASADAVEAQAIVDKAKASISTLAVDPNLPDFKKYAAQARGILIIPSLIKGGLSRTLPAQGRRSSSKIAKREKGIWQRRYWEHVIRDDADLARHVDYIHFNPVKHGYVSRASDWPHSSFHLYVARGALPSDWGGDVSDIGGRFGE